MQFHCRVVEKCHDNVLCVCVTELFPPPHQFHTQQSEKRQKAACEAREVQQYHRSQVKEQHARLQADREEERKHTDENNTLLRVEERQFQEYAQRVIGEASDRGAPTQPLWTAAKSGAGIYIHTCTILYHNNYRFNILYSLFYVQSCSFVLSA